MNCALSTAYWPNLHYFYYLLNADKVIIECFENYQKQSFRNRTVILSANGPLNLVIPIKKRADKELIKDLEISFQDNWQINHWRAILSAYKNSPYFEHFETEIESFYTRRYESLLHYNGEQLALIFKLLKLKSSVSQSTSYETIPGDCLDLREKIHPKISYTNDLIVAGTLQKPYYQTFQDKFDFFPNLSILDLLFNTGLGTIDYLKTSP
jgi:hypothetical protein